MSQRDVLVKFHLRQGLAQTGPDPARHGTPRFDLTPAASPNLKAAPDLGLSGNASAPARSTAAPRAKPGAATPAGGKTVLPTKARTTPGRQCAMTENALRFFWSCKVAATVTRKAAVPSARPRHAIVPAVPSASSQGLEPMDGNFPGRIGFEARQRCAGGVARRPAERPEPIALAVETPFMRQRATARAGAAAGGEFETKPNLPGKRRKSQGGDNGES